MKRMYSRKKSYQLLYPGVPGTAPLAAAAASLCFLFTRKLWNRKSFHLSEDPRCSLFPYPIWLLLLLPYQRKRKYRILDSIVHFFLPLYFFLSRISFDISRRASQFPGSPLRRWKLASTHANGIIPIRTTGSSTPTRIPEVVASPPSKRSRCDRVYPSSSMLRASPSPSFAPPVVSAAPKARTKREGNKET